MALNKSNQIKYFIFITLSLFGFALFNFPEINLFDGIIPFSFSSFINFLFTLFFGFEPGSEAIQVSDRNFGIFLRLLFSGLHFFNFFIFLILFLSNQLIFEFEDIFQGMFDLLQIFQWINLILKHFLDICPLSLFLPLDGFFGGCSTDFEDVVLSFLSLKS